MRVSRQRMRLIGWAFLPVLAALPLASGLKAATVLEYESTLSLRSGRGGLPAAVTVQAKSDELCVTDARSASAHLFNDRDVELFQTGATAGLADPKDISVDARGGFVCTDSRPEGGRTIRRLNFFGEPVAYTPENPENRWRPEHLLITRDGNYVTTDPARSSLVKHDAETGALLWEHFLGSERSGELLGLGRPAEGPDGRIYVPLGADKMILVLSPEGERLTSFGRPGTSRGRLSFPVGVAFCPGGTIAVLDRLRHVVLLFDPEYDFLAEFGRFGAGPRDFYHPAAIAADSNGRVFVAQGYQGRIHVFRFLTTQSALPTTTRSWRSYAGRAGEASSIPGRMGVPLTNPRASTAMGRSHVTITDRPIHQDQHNGGC